MVYSKTRQLTRRFGRKRTRRLRTQKRNVSRRIVKTYKNRRNYSGGVISARKKEERKKEELRKIKLEVSRESALEVSRESALNDRSLNVRYPAYKHVMIALEDSSPGFLDAKICYIIDSLFFHFDTSWTDRDDVILISPEFRLLGVGDKIEDKSVERYGDRTFSDIPESEKVLYRPMSQDTKDEIRSYLRLVLKHIPKTFQYELATILIPKLREVDPTFVRIGDAAFIEIFETIGHNFIEHIEANPTNYSDLSVNSKKQRFGGAAPIFQALQRAQSRVIWTTFLAKFASLPNPAVVVIPDFPNTTCHPLCEPGPVQREFNTVEFAFVLSADPSPIVLRPNPPHHYTLPVSIPVLNSDYFNPVGSEIQPTDSFADKRRKTNFRVFDFNSTNDIDAEGHGRNRINFGCIFIGSQISPSGISVAHDYNPERLAIEAEFTTIQRTPPPPNPPLYPYFPTRLFVGNPRKNHLTSEHVANAFFAEAVERDYGIKINNHQDARYNCCLQLAHTNHRTAMFERMYARSGYVCNAFNHHNITQYNAAVAAALATGADVGAIQYVPFFYAVWVCNNFIPSENPSLTTIHGGHFLRATFVCCPLTAVADPAGGPGRVLERNNNWTEVENLFDLRTLFVTTVPQWIKSAVVGNTPISKLMGSFQMIRIMATFRYGMFNPLVATHDS